MPFKAEREIDRIAARDKYFSLLNDPSSEAKRERRKLVRLLKDLAAEQRRDGRYERTKKPKPAKPENVWILERSILWPNLEPIN
jgi:hypothetical protein